MNPIEFWSWFEKNARRFLSLKHGADEESLDEIQTHLQSYCSGLWFEIGGAPDGPMEFVISAEGDEQFFPMVEALSVAAPSIDGWSIIAFKPPHGFDFVTNYGGLEINPKHCWFLPLVSKTEPGRIALRIGVPDFKVDAVHETVAALYIVLEAGLGELVAGQRIAFIEACAIPNDPEVQGFIELNELDLYIQWISRRKDV